MHCKNSYSWIRVTRTHTYNHCSNCVCMTSYIRARGWSDGFNYKHLSQGDWALYKQLKPTDPDGRLLCIYVSWIWRMLPWRGAGEKGSEARRGLVLCWFSVSASFSGLEMIKKFALFVCKRTQCAVPLQPPADAYYCDSLAHTDTRAHTDSKLILNLENQSTLLHLRGRY